MNRALLGIAEPDGALTDSLKQQHNALGKPQPLSLLIATEGQGDIRKLLVKRHSKSRHTILKSNLHTTAWQRWSAQQIGLPLFELKLMNAVQRSPTWGVLSAFCKLDSAPEADGSSPETPCIPEQTFRSDISYMTTFIDHPCMMLAGEPFAPDERGRDQPDLPAGPYMGYTTGQDRTGQDRTFALCSQL